MLKQTITYTNFDGIEVTEDFYFNISRVELVQMEVHTPGGYVNYLQRIIDAKDSSALMDAFLDLVKTAYGVKSPDGKKFIKSKEAADEFVNSAAYDELFVEFMTDADFASNFALNVLPKNVDKLAENIQKANAATAPRFISVPGDSN